MALKTILNKQTDFTGEFPVEYAKSGLWRFNDVSVDEYGYLADSSGLDRKIELVNYLGTTASLQSGQKGRQIRININNPATEKTYLKVANDGTFFSEMGERILVGGWMIPTTYSVGNTYCPILNTRYGPGQPIFYERIGFSRPVVLDSNGAWEAVLENAYNIVVTSEINGEDTLSFMIPYRDPKRGFIDSEKKIQIVDDIYKVRTLTDTKDIEGNLATEVYAEAEFYDLTFSVRKEEHKFDAETAEVSMAYALEGTEWSVGTVNVRTKRTWTSTEKNALSILRMVADLHGGDLVFDCPNRLVHLLTVYGTDSGALFAYKKNMKSIKRVVDTRSLVTRLYAIGSL